MNLYEKFSRILALFITLMGAFFLVGWFLNLPSILNPPPSGWPIPLSAAWCIFLGGLGSLSIFSPSRLFVLKNICAVLILCLSIWRFLEILFQQDLGLNWILLQELSYSPANFPPMAFLGVVGFISVGLILIFWSRYSTYKTKSTMLLLFSSILIMLGFTGTLWYFLPSHLIYGWRDRIPLNFYTAIAQILLGTGFLTHRFILDIYKKSNVTKWMALFTPALILAFIAILNYGFSESNKVVIYSILESKNETVELISKIKIKNDIDILTAIAKQNGLLSEIPETALIFKNSEINRVIRIDSNFVIQDEIPNKTDLNISTDLHNKISQKPVFIYFNPDSRKLFLCASIIQNHQFEGACIAELELAKIFNSIDGEILRNFVFTVLYENNVIFSTSPTEKIKTMHISRDVAIENLSLTFETFPTKDLLEYRLNRLFGFTLLFGSILLCFAIGYLIYLWHSWLLLAKKTQTILQFSKELLLSLNKIDQLSNVCKKLMTLINQLHPWNMLVLWKWNSTSRTLEYSDVIYNDSIRFPHFEEFCKKPPTLDRKNLELQVFNECKSVYVKDLSQAADYICSQPASKDGIQGAIAFPLFEGDQPSGVILILKNEPFIPEVEPEIIDLLPTIGIELGQYIQRQRFEKTQKNYANIIQYSAEAIFSLDIEGTIQSWNPGAEKIYGWEADEIIGQNIFDKTFLPKDKKEIETRKKALREGQPVLHWEGQRVRKDGSLVWLSINTSPILNSMGAQIGTVAICHDISEEKKIALELTKSEEKCRSFIETTNEWIWEMNTSFQYTYSNATVKKMLGYDPNELMEVALFFIVSPGDQQKIQTELELCLKNKTGWKHRVILKKKNGDPCWIESTGVPFFNEKGDLIGFRGADRDISDEINTEQAKNEFISIVSHELRTPLTSIAGAVGLLLAAEKDFSPKNRELITLAERNCNRLTKTINDILDIEKLQLSKLELKMQPMILAKPIRDAIHLVNPMASQLEVTLLEGPMIENLQVYADYDRLIQVMLNLLSNAIKFSPVNGKVTVWMEQLGDRVRVSIKDEGKGIPIALQPEIFEKFKKTEQSDARVAGGTGLGLNICKNLIELMGGSIHFTTQNVGTIFYFELPIQA